MKNIMQIDEKIINYFMSLNFEKQGYESLIKEFTIDAPEDGLILDENKYNILLTKYNEINKKIGLLILEVTGAHKINNYMINFEKKEITWDE
jgi:hypothetical protein